MTKSKQVTTREPSIRHQVAIAGKVIDAATRQAIAGAEISLSEMPIKYKSVLKLKAMQYGAAAWQQMRQRPDRTYSHQDGYYFFRDLPVGDYTLTAWLPNAATRYGSVSQNIAIAPNSINPVYIDLLLPTTGIQGKITAPENEKFMAKVQIQGQSGYALTNGDGEYLLTGIEASQEAVTLTIVAAGYELNLPQELAPSLAPSKVFLVQGQVLTEQNFQLKRKSIVPITSSSANRSPPQ